MKDAGGRTAEAGVAVSFLIVNYNMRPLVESCIAGVIRQMARAACGLVAAGQRDSALDLVKAGLGLGRKAESKRLGPESVRPPAEQAGRAAGSSAGALSG